MLNPNHPVEIILIDDDPLQHLICRKILSHIEFRGEFKSFYNGIEGFNHILTKKHSPSAFPKTIIFLDLNMPIMDGWEFLEYFGKFDKPIKSNYSVHILTSSILNSEREKASSSKEVIGYFQKPLLLENLDWIFKNFKNSTPLGIVLNREVK